MVVVGGGGVTREWDVLGLGGGGAPVWDAVGVGEGGVKLVWDAVRVGERKTNMGCRRSGRLVA